MRRLALVAAALVVPVLPVLAAAPAFAADSVICVNTAGGTCTQSAATIPAAITAANANLVDDTILVGPGTYTDGPYTLDGAAHALTLKGSGQGSTILTLLPSASIQNYVNLTHAAVQDLTITMAPGPTSDNDKGVNLLNASVAQRVTVDGTGTLNARGLNSFNSQLTSSSVLMPVSDSNSRAVYSDGGTTVTDSTLTGAQGFTHSGGSTTDTLSRVTVRASYAGVSLDGGTVNVDDAVIDLGASAGAGLQVANFNGALNPMTINAANVTIVGGAVGSKGAWAYSSIANAKQTSAINLTSSIVRGPATSLVAEAGNNGAQGGSSSATIAVSYSDYKNVGGTIGANGAGGVVPGAGNVTDVDPAFVNAVGGDYHLTAASPLVDKGNPAAGGPATDRDGLARATDGDGNGTAVADMGAYERPGVVVVTPPPPPLDKTAPETTITKLPKKKSVAAKAKLSFTSEPGAAFQCQLDGGAWKACTSPYKVKVKLGKHTLLVRAIDKAGNVDATPAKAKFKRIKKA